MGKAAPEEPPIPIQTENEGQLQDDMAAQMMEAMMMMAMMGSPAVPAVPAAPPIDRVPDIDWSEKQKRIASKMKADYHVSQLQRHGRAQTIHTSPLLDTQEAETTEQTLIGS